MVRPSNIIRGARKKIKKRKAKKRAKKLKRRRKLRPVTKEIEATKAEAGKLADEFSGSDAVRDVAEKVRDGDGDGYAGEEFFRTGGGETFGPAERRAPADGEDLFDRGGREASDAELFDSGRRDMTDDDLFKL